MEQQPELTPTLRPVYQSLTNRVVLRTSVIHCPDGGEQQSWGKPRSYVLESREQAHVAWVTLSEEWQMLDFGHIDDPSLVLIENSLRDNTGIVDLAAETGVPAFSKIRQGRDAAIPEPSCLAARCVGGKSKVKVVVIPR